ncbi:MAG: Sensor protein [uncultured bacterium (gcode 4)]|uniref:histidine kinase n=1 Tax=uncultured bacterium (gcode 4) TaxID=1234023 RepID=K2G4Z7_9BACT|nr:MAG: Sensor protein [uncultured bacterium (gcode 4)]
MPTKKIKTDNIEWYSIPKSFSYNIDENDLRWIFEDSSYDEKQSNHFPLLNSKEKHEISKVVNENKDKILREWIQEKWMKQFYKKFNINKEDVSEYICYFWWEKILTSLVSELEDAGLEWKNPYISTRFLAFIKFKKIWVDDLLKIVILLKNCVIEHFLELELRIINQITVIFDKIATNLSKNYNDIIIKLLNEYTNAIDNSNIISKTDIYWNIIEVNDAFCKLSWFTRDEMIWRSHNIVRHPDMPKETFRQMWETIQNKRIWKWVIKNKTKNDSSYWVKATVVPIVDENDKIIEYISIRTEITELKEAYKNLEEYTAALNETNLVLKMNRSGIIESVNDKFLKMSWYRKEELIWKCYISQLFPKNTNPEHNTNIPIVGTEDIREMQNCLRHKKIWRWVIKNRSKKWLHFWTSSNFVPILDLNDDVVEYVVIQTDITDLEIAQQELKISLNKQKELDTKKDEFLNIASHELRTPMTSVKWYISMILDWDAGDINPEVRTYLEKVYKSSQRLLNLINDMLDVSKIESWNQEINFESIDLAALIRETWEEIRSLFEKKWQKFTNIIDFESFEYNTDWNKLKQVLLNMLWNANKFTREWGEIILKTYLEEERIIISVRDTWIWIAKLDIPKVFEKFWQVKNSLTRDINWTWLWLPISKAIIEKLGWYMELESELWKGSTFKLYLPIKK